MSRWYPCGPTAHGMKGRLRACLRVVKINNSVNLNKIMPISIAFWVLMLIWLVWGVYSNRANIQGAGPTILQFLLFGLLGYAVFGSALHH